MSERQQYLAVKDNKLSGRLRPDKRGEARHTIALPATVMGCQADAWSEHTETINVSSKGVALRLSRRVMIGDILYVEIPLPERFRTGGEEGAGYAGYARVRYVEIHGPEQILRLEFLRQDPRRSLP